MEDWALNLSEVLVLLLSFKPKIFLNASLIKRKDCLVICLCTARVLLGRVEVLRLAILKVSWHGTLHLRVPTCVCSCGTAFPFCDIPSPAWTCRGNRWTGTVLESFPVFNFQVTE